MKTIEDKQEWMKLNKAMDLTKYIRMSVQEALSKEQTLTQRITSKKEVHPQE